MDLYDVSVWVSQEGVVDAVLLAVLGTALDTVVAALGRDALTPPVDIIDHHGEYHAVGRHHLVAAARDARRERRASAAAAYDSASVALEYALSAQITTPSRAAARNEMQIGVREAVQALAPFDREILCLRHFEELDNAEAASALDIDPGTASKRYVRAIVRLREVLAAARLDAPSL